jgi:transposase
MEASGHARWFEGLLKDLQFELWIGDAAEIRTKRVRKQKTDRQDAQLLLKLMVEDRFPRIWVADAERELLERERAERPRCEPVELVRWGVCEHQPEVRQLPPAYWEIMADRIA